MSRHWQTEALVLQVKSMGEDNRSIALLTRSRGLIWATLYGGPKSKMRALVSPFHCGQIYLYTDEVKQATKISDFAIDSYRPEIRENLFKTCAANLCSELVIKTHGGGEIEQLWLYVNSFLDGLCVVNEEAARHALLRFIWRFLNTMGMQPDPCECASCGTSVCSIYNTQKVFFSLAESSFYCAHCSSRGSESKGFFLHKEVVDYLRIITTEAPRVSRDIVLEEAFFYETQDFLVYILQNFSGQKFNSLDVLLKV